MSPFHAALTPEERFSEMRMKAGLSSAVLVVVMVGSSAVLAEKQDPIAERQALMKDTGKHTKMGAAMAKGEQPFDLATAKEIFATYEKTAAKAPELFPAGSTKGHKTTASPKIWEKMDDFKKRFATFGEDAKKAQASVTDLDSFRAAFGPLTKDNCGGCHKEYRIKRD